MSLINSAKIPYGSMFPHLLLRVYHPFPFLHTLQKGSLYQSLVFMQVPVVDGRTPVDCVTQVDIEAAGTIWLPRFLLG
jgi:hypothetical protein